jgi:hypothetical protein
VGQEAHDPTAQPRLYENGGLRSQKLANPPYAERYFTIRSLAGGRNLST